MFVIPENLEQYSVHGLQDLAKIADQELKTLVASVQNPQDVSDETLERGEALKTFTKSVDAEIKARTEKASRFAKMSEDEAAETEEEGSEAPAEGEGSEDEESKKEYATTVAVTTPAGTQLVSATITKGAPETTVRPGIADVVGASTNEPIPVRNGDHYSIVAAADLGMDLPAGADIGWEGLGKAFEARVRSYPTKPTARRGAKFNRLQNTFALVRREFPEHQQLLDNDGEMSLYTKLNNVSKTSLQRAGESMSALTAAVGWCAPSETIYSICNPVTADGLLDTPEVVARRGGIRHNQGIDWVTFFGGTYPALDTNVPGMSILTEAQVIADTAKTCLEIDCPPFVDERLNVAALCLTGSLLQNRGYPEYVSEFTQGAMAAFAHFVNREVIDIIEDGSVAVTLAATDPWVADGTVLSNLMSAVEYAVKDMRYRLRLSMSAPMDVVLPYWIGAMLRADYIRRNAAANDDLADSQIASMFATRGARVQYVYDWQDAFSGVAGGFGATTAPTAVPTTVRFLIWPPGTWVIARQDVIRLDTVYDSVNLQQNLVTQLFMEDGFLPMRMCPLSRVYTVPICPNGSTGFQREIDCITVA